MTILSPADRVLCLEWGAGPVGAMRDLGVAVTCVAAIGDPGVPDRLPVNVQVVSVRDHSRVEDVLAGLASAGLTPADFTAVGTDDEFSVVTAAVLAALGGARGMPVPVALALRDKLEQKRLVRAAGLPTARCALAGSLAEAKGVGVEPPLVIKPPAGAGTQRTWAVHTADDLAAMPDEPGPWLVEEFVPGEELHVDGVVRAGVLVVAVVSRYLHNVIGVRDGDLVASTTVEDPDLVERATELTAAALAALGHRDGVFHLEAFHDNDSLVFGECAGRIGGGMVAETVLAKSGVDLYAEQAAALLGVPSPAVVSTTPDVLGWANLPVPAGRITRLPSQAEIAARPGVAAAQVWKRAGDVVSDPSGGSHLLAAKVMVRAPSAEAAREALTGTAAWFADTAQVVPE